MTLSHADLLDDLGRRETAKQRVLAALRAAGEHGLTNVDLNAICYRYGARIHELRGEGYRVDKQEGAGGLVRYWLRPQDRLF